MMRRFIALSAVLTVALASCSLGPREVWADSMKDAYQTATKIGSARVRVTVAVKVIETTIRVYPEPLFVTLDGVVDFKSRRSSLTILDPKPKKKVLFNDLVSYLPRSKTSIGEGHRKWAKFDFKRKPDADIDSTDRRIAVGVGMISPAIAVELLKGVLAGSVKDEGPETFGTASATGYSFKLAPDAAVRELRDEKRSDGILRLMSTLGVTDDIIPAEAWMDPKGLPRQIRFVLQQHKDRVNRFEMRQKWVFYDYGAKASVSLPARSDTISPDRFRDYIAEFVREAG